MGNFKEIEIKIKSKSEKPFNIQRTIYKEFFQILDKQDINYLISNARGNAKVAMNMALGDLNG